MMGMFLTSVGKGSQQQPKFQLYVLVGALAFLHPFHSLGVGIHWMRWCIRLVPFCNVLFLFISGVRSPEFFSHIPCHCVMRGSCIFLRLWIFHCRCCHLCAKRCRCPQGSAYALLCMPCWLGILRFDRTFQTRKVEVLHPVPLYYQTLPMLIAPAGWYLVPALHAPGFGKSRQAACPVGLHLHDGTLSSGDNGYVR